MARSIIITFFERATKGLRIWGWLLAVLFLALVLRLPLLGGSLWLDEAAQALESARPLSQQLEIIPDFQPPLIHLLLHFVMYVSDSEWWMRWWVAVLPGLGSILFTMLLTDRVLGRRSAVAGGLLLATSTIHIFYSQELRPYALPMLWAALSWWLIVTQIQSRPNQSIGWRWWVVVSILGWYSSYLYPFLWLTQVIWLTWKVRQNWFTLASHALVVIVAFLPWLPTFRLQLAAGGAVRVGLPGWSEVVSLTQLKSVPLVAGKFLFGVVNIGKIWWQILALIGLGAGLSYVVGRAWTKTTNRWVRIRSVGWLWLWAALPLLGAWVVSFWIPVIQPKRVLWLLPAWYMLLLWLVRQARSAWLGRAIVAGLLMINVIGIGHYWTQPALQRENWRSAQQWISKSYPADRTLVVFAFDEAFAPWRWYDQQYQTLAFGTGKFSVQQVPALRQHLAAVEYYDFVVTFDYLSDLSDPQDRLSAELASYGFQEVDMVAYPNIGFIRVWARPASLLSAK